MKKISETLISMNLIIFIFIWFPAFVKKDMVLMYYTISFLQFSSTVIIYALLKRISNGKAN